MLGLGPSPPNPSPVCHGASVSTCRKDLVSNSRTTAAYLDGRRRRLPVPSVGEETRALRGRASATSLLYNDTFNNRSEQVKR